jgi:hypothetical protein
LIKDLGNTCFTQKDSDMAALGDDACDFMTMLLEDFNSERERDMESGTQRTDSSERLIVS